MSPMRILAFSSSRVANGEYLEEVVPEVTRFLGNEPKRIVFIPFASVDSYDDYLLKVTTAFKNTNYVFDVAGEVNAGGLIELADVIMVGGGNTFKLLHDLYKSDVFQIIQNKVNNGTPYIGWSAGSNLTGLTISTTNDMPIVEPKSFKAFSFLPFQLNPHYLNEVVVGHNGETRDQRLTEFLKVNPTVTVIGIPEGSWLLREGERLEYLGIKEGVLFTNENGAVVKKSLLVNSDVSHFLR